MKDLEGGKPIRVLHIFNYFNQGGVENFIMNVYRNLNRSQIQFDFAFPINKKGYFDDEVLSLGGRIFFFDSDKKSLWNYYKNLKRIINNYGPYAAIHSHVYFFSGYILFVARLCGVKIRIAHSHDTKKGRKPTLFRKCYENFMRWLIKKNATYCLACSMEAGNIVFGNRNLYQLLYYGIDLKRFRFNQTKRLITREKLSINNEFVILNIGRFTAQKNHSFILHVFKRLLEEKPESFLILIGTGPLKKEAEKYIHESGIENKVKILSDIQNTEDYYSAADVFVLPSIYEGLGIVNIEAQAMNLPVFISDKVPNDVCITDIIKVLPINGTEKLWADSLRSICDNYKTNRSSHLIDFTNSPFNIKETVRVLKNIYTS